ncbi:MAG TPA: FAD-dependent oxidoreductase, partial [Thermomicrobiales bacterium]|nr:FAD-dependent oxidoreductase [Thermomicrobiales bacterium]
MADVPAPAQTFDLVLLGGGTGGYVAAIRAKQLGLSVAVVEELILGGCCLHRGCIPTKAFLKSADMYDDVKRAAEFGIDIKGEISFNYDTALSRSKGIVASQYKGLMYLFEKKHQIPVFMGRGKLVNKTTVGVTPNDGSAPFSLTAGKIIINTGSRPRAIKGIPIDGKRVISSDHTVVLDKLPKSIIVRGGGATGLEWATAYHRYGVPTTLVGNIVPPEAEEVQQALLRALQRQKMDIILGARPTAEDIDITKDGVTMRVKDPKGKERTLQAETLMVGLGREACIENIGLEEVGIAVENGFIAADNMLRTNIDGIYAIGDVNGQQMLAHTAMHHGIIAVEHIMGLNPFPLNIFNSPSCTYCSPEIGSVGYTEKQARDLGFNVKVGKFPMKPNAKANIEGHTDGFAKIVADA